MGPAVLRNTVTDLLTRAYETYADHPAVVRQSGAAVSYRELGQLVRQLAGGLRDLGLSPGARVVVAAKNSAEFMLVDHALLWSGLVRVAVSFRLHQREIAQIAADCAAAAVVVDPEAVESVRDALVDLGLTSHIIQTAGSATDLTVDSLASSGTAVPSRSAEPEDLAWMPYTSGTTGKPKGVMHTHRSIVACLRNLSAELPPITVTDTLLQVAPMSHLAGWVGLLYAVRGASQVFLAEFDAKQVLSTIERFRITAIPVVPTIVNLLTEEAEAGAYDVSSLRTVIYAGSPISPDKLARAIAAFGEVFIQGYGLTELPLPIASLSQPEHRIAEDGTLPEQLGSAGRITPFVEARIVDQDGVDVKAGEAGEIWVRGDMVMSGYWQRPDDTDAFVQEGGWCATGDVGRFVDGYLYIIDRKRDMIVSGGFNVFPGEVENVVASVHGVAEVAVIGVPDQRWGESVMAVVVRAEGSELSEGEIDSACRDALAGYKLPRRIEFVDALPKSTTGKLLRRELKSRHWQGRARLIDG